MRRNARALILAAVVEQPNRLWAHLRGHRLPIGREFTKLPR
jgi:hypothetical protein